MNGGQRRTEPSRRLVLLGASNVARSFSTIVQTARVAWPEPLDVLAALGHGRSYGTRSHVLGRGLPGILECGLWRALHERSALPTTALVTDIGNDLLYGVPVDRIARWVEQCLQRLREQSAEVWMTQLPLVNLRRLGAARFHFFRTLFFPRSRLTFARATTDARQLNEQLIEVAQRHNATLIDPDAAWYGWDPVHIRRSCFARVWQDVFQRALPSRACELADVSLSLWWQLHRLIPENRTWFGVRQSQRQPAARLSDGTRISLY